MEERNLFSRASVFLTWCRAHNCSRYVLIGTILLAACLSLVIMGYRAYSVIECSPFCFTGGTEEPALYSVYRVYLGKTPYQDLQNNATAALFNWGFYYVYGTIARGLVSAPEDVVTAVRLTTLFLGTLLTSGIAVTLPSAFRLKRSPRVILLCGGVTILIMLGTWMGWFAIAGRPDLAALGFEVLGFLIFLMAIDRGEEGIRTYGNLFAASLLFAIGWCFKQTYLLLFLSALLVLFLRGQYKRLIFLLIPYGTVVIGSFLFSGEHYISHILKAPSVASLTVHNAFDIAIKALPAGGFLIVLPMTLFFLDSKQHRLSNPVKSLLIALTLCLLGNLVSIGKGGASRNYLNETYAISLLLSLYLLTHRQSVYKEWLASVFFILLIGQGLMYIVFWNRVGRMDARTYDMPCIEAARSVTQHVSPPYLIEQGNLALPWVAGDRRGTTEVFDFWYYRFAHETGIQDGVENRIGQKYYNVGLVWSADRSALNWYENLEEAGYQQIDQICEDILVFTAP